MFLLIFYKKSVEDLSVHRDGSYLPWNEFAAVLEGFFCCHFQASTAWDLHADDGYTGDIVVSDDFFEFSAVVYGIQFRAAYQNDPAFDKIFMEVCVGISRTVCRNQEFRAVEIWGICRNKFDLYRPLTQLGADR